MSILEIRNVTHCFGDLRTLDNIVLHKSGRRTDQSLMCAEIKVC